MLFTPTLALLALAFNFCTLFHVTSNWSDLGVRRWHTLDHAIYALEEKTVAAYENYLDIIAPPPLTSPPAYFPALRHAEWVYRSSAVRVLDLVDGSSDVRTLSDVASLPLPPTPPTKPAGPVASAGALPPTLTSLVDPATFISFLTRDLSTQPVATLSALLLSCLKCFISCLTCTSAFAWLKDRRRQYVSRLKPTLTCDVHCQSPTEDFHSVYTATPIPSYPPSEAGTAELEGSSVSPRDSRIEFPTASRTFPLVVTNPDGKTLFNAEIKFSSNNVVTEVSATSSTVAFSVDVVASLDIPAVSEWYMPAKEDNGVSYKAEDSLFLLLVRGSGDWAPLSEESQGLDRASEPEGDVPFVERTPEAEARVLVSDCEVEDVDKDEIPPLGSPMCAVNIPFHHRGFSAFETSLINSCTMMRRAEARPGNRTQYGTRRRNKRPKDVRFAWLKDLCSCGDTHLDGCPCEDLLAEHVLAGRHPLPEVLSEIFHDHDTVRESHPDTHSGERSGVCEKAYTVSPGSSARSEMFPTGIFGPAEPRLTAHSDPSHADGKELAGRDSTVALMPPFSVGSSELPLRCRSSGISNPAEFSDGSFGEQDMSLEEDDVGMGPSGSKLDHIIRLADSVSSPPSPAAPARVDMLMESLEPILADDATSPSLEGAMLVRPPSIYNHPERSPLEYSPASVRAHSPVEGAPPLEYDDWVGDSVGADEDADSEGVSKTEPQFPIRRFQQAAPQTPQRR